MLNNRLLLWYNTIKYLKVKQIVWRGIYLLPKVFKINFFYSQNYSQNQIVVFKKDFILYQGITEDYIHFTFLNKTENIRVIGWDNNNVNKLWIYNLHYFQYLLQFDHVLNKVELQLSVISDWILMNPIGKGSGWDPYPTSHRIINWIKWSAVTGVMPAVVKRSLWDQLNWLMTRLEFHIMGNHLFMNAKAIMYACAFFQIEEKSSIYIRGLKIVKMQLDEQFLNDGAHFELSPMYHSLAMEDLLDLISISSNLPLSFPKDLIIKKFTKGMEWLSSVIYDNEELPHFNDCANKIAPKYSELYEYSKKLGLVLKFDNNAILKYLENSGYVVCKNKIFQLIVDIGHVGPSYLPGHGHADTLSFEIAIWGHRVVVNSGTSIYENSLERLRQRSTSAHSTVEIDYQNSSEVWSGFRVARRAIPFDINIRTTDCQNDKISIKASHDGFKRLKNAPIHRRSWYFDGCTWNIKDEISGVNNIVVSRYYLHPEIEMIYDGNGFFVVKNYIKLARIFVSDTTDVVIRDSTYHDEFGVVKHNQFLEVKSISPCEIKLVIELIVS
jgi:uncharacterized heparinase superfamily protein